MKQDIINQITAISQTEQSQQRNIPPLENWRPAYCGEMNLTIKANGEWYHDGQKMTRQSMIDLFAKVLWAEIDDYQQIRYFLKTPAEKIAITVEDVPLHIVNVSQIVKDNQTLIEFSTSQGDRFYLDDFHQLRFGLPFVNINSSSAQIEKQQNQPYILVRQNANSVLYALILRNVFYHLVEMGELMTTDDKISLCLESGNKKFCLTMLVK